MIDEIIYNGKKYPVIDSATMRELIMSDFKKNLDNGMNKFPALSQTLSKIPQRCYFMSAGVGKKDVKKFLNGLFAKEHNQVTGGKV